MHWDGVMEGRLVPVLIVSESALVSMGLHHILESAGADFLIRDAATGVLTTELVEANGAEVVILDAHNPTDVHVDMVRTLKTTMPNVGLVAVTSGRDAAALGAMVLAGVDAVLDVTVTPEALVEVLRLLQRQVRFVTTYEIWPAILKHLTAFGAHDDDRTAVLTPREREVYDLLRDGRTDREIAQALTLSLWTVKHHVGNILQKLDLRSRREVLHV
jgi:DNA-binding NarL/FixJ family response regulator